ncbi:hypothetical protein llap_7160 [Limosa lapponica baueri]|uniref:Uncharacterized protein n=1 Tax=Limosa lapponica baueri TaxID=1758121 RepID=A0A2I0U925_LIMLA|nr:hypothetical protein llap_7160 [Limosa lapponica baueri]
MDEQTTLAYCNLLVPMTERSSQVTASRIPLAPPPSLSASIPVACGVPNIAETPSTLHKKAHWIETFPGLMLGEEDTRTWKGQEIRGGKKALPAAPLGSVLLALEENLSEQGSVQRLVSRSGMTAAAELWEQGEKKTAFFWGEEIMMTYDRKCSHLSNLPPKVAEKSDVEMSTRTGILPRGILLISKNDYQHIDLKKEKYGKGKGKREEKRREEKRREEKRREEKRREEKRREEEKEKEKFPQKDLPLLRDT